MTLSCKDKNSQSALEYFEKQREQSQRVREHYEKSEEEFEDLKARLQTKFKETPYQLEITMTFLESPPTEGKIYSEDLIAIKFGSFLSIEGADTDEKIQAVKKGILEVVTQEEWKRMKVLLVTGEVDGVKQLRGFNMD